MSVLPSNVLISDVLDLIKNDTPKVALYTSNPGPANTGTEVTGGSYTREAVTFTKTGSQLTNSGEVRFDVPTATVTHYGIFDALTLGNLLCYGTLASTKVVVSGDEIVFPIGSIVINFAGS